jgi:multiple sugar transport system ATP-binding protein
VFLFDEPLSNLDAALRGQVRIEIADLHRRLGATMVYVTHDQIEAMTLADRIVVLNDGIVQQIGSPSDLYRRPANTFVATFIGSPRMNILAGKGAGARVEIAEAGSLPTDIVVQGAVTVGVRPNGFDVSADLSEGLVGSLMGEEYLGAESYLHVRLGNGELAAAQVHPDHGWKIGQRLALRLRPGNLHLFDGQTGTRLAHIA